MKLTRYRQGSTLAELMVAIVLIIATLAALNKLAIGIAARKTSAATTIHALDLLHQAESSNRAGVPVNASVFGESGANLLITTSEQVDAALGIAVSTIEVRENRGGVQKTVAFERIVKALGRTVPISQTEDLASLSAASLARVTVLSDPTQGTVSIAGGGSSGLYEYGSALTISATPRTGYTFTRWEGPGVTATTSSTATITVNDDKALTAIFTATSGSTGNGNGNGGVGNGNGNGNGKHG